ncbi:MAG: sodium:solute symporter family protein [Thermoguttaceae bacterium]|nr:sodium:solute symporter family protein [Thermoguttaceae bacterium]
MPSSAARFTELDWCVLVGYFVAITAFGLWVSRKIRSSGGYFLGDRQLPWWVMIGQSFGTGTNAENPVAQAGSAYQFGFATIWYQWKNMLITPFYWLMAPWYRRAEKTTIGEIVEERYGRGLALLYTVYAIAFFVFNQGAMLKGAGKAISVATGGEIISANGVVLAMTAAFLLYSFVGGLVASAYTDFVQGFLIIVLSFLLIPFGLAEVGGFAGMRATLAADFPDFFDLYNEASRIDAFTIAMLSLNGLVGITAQPHILTMNATGRTERAGRVGQTYGSFVKRLCTIGWAWTGLIVAATVLQRGHLLKDPEAAFGYACLHLLGPGLVGLIVACVLAANMSTCSNFMVNTGALFTRNLYRAYFRPHAGDRELLWVGRLSGLGLTVAGVLFGLYVREVLQAFLFTETIAALMGIMILGGFLWKRANRAGALAGTLVAFGVYYALGYLMTCRSGDAPATLGAAWDQLVAAWHDGRLAPFLASGHLQIVYKWSAMPFAWAMAAGAVAFVLGSLLTRPEDPQRIARFFDNQARSTDGEGLPEGAPKPPAADRGQDLILLDLPGWLTRRRWHGFFRRYREDLVGFVLAWGSVGALVLLAWALMQIGR